MYGNLCWLGRFGVFNTDFFELYGVENMDVDTDISFLSLLFQKLKHFQVFHN